MLRKEDLEDFASTKEQTQFKPYGDIMKQHGIEVIVPIFVNNELNDLLLLGEKLSGDHFFIEDINMLQTISNHASISLKNASLYVELENEVQDKSKEIDERKKVERALRENEEYLSRAQEIAQLGYWKLDPETNKIMGSEEFFRILGLQYTQNNYSEFLDTILPEDRGLVTSAIENTLKRKKPYDIEYRITTRDGQQKVVHAIGEDLQDESENSVQTIGVLQDITERVKTMSEKEHLETQLRQSQKMEAIGTLAGGIAHDFNNILSAIIGFSEMAKDDAPEDSTIRSDLHEVLIAGKRAKDLVNQILAFSRQSDKELKPVRMHLIVKEVMHMMRASLPATIKITKNIDPNSEHVLADPTQIHQILVNLCTNASHAMQQTGGELYVELKNIEIDNPKAYANPNLTKGKYVRLTVKDTGKGMDPVTLERVFEPYFTTKPVGEGTGMGLSVVHGIITSLNGAILVKSTPETGTEFEIFLPHFDSSDGYGSMKNREMPLSPNGSERILFVDDEETLADMGQKALERLGYSVTSRTSSVEALKAFKAQPDKFDIVITDQTMPNLTGMDLAKELITIRSDIPIILCTGFNLEATPERIKEIGIKELVQKPIVGTELGIIIRQILGSELRQKAEVF